MVCCVRCSKGCKICCVSAILLVILLVVVVVVLFFTVFKPKDPDITLQSVKLEGFKLELPTFKLNLSLGVVVTVENPNHGSFTYQNSTAHLYHRGTLVAQAPLHEDTIPARHDHNITTSLSVFADISELKDLSTDYSRGVINLTSTVTLFGKVKVLNLLKMKATSYSTCYLSLFIPHQSIDSMCNSEIKL
ncbi:Late embryogenesis abundant protein [Vigna unguiculata]|uniref:Late embryogenesis abundant protein n=1 Tax=Vigna unguiculata TaxID=3917 RepID=A0A4D6LVB7_VIGUN|nr:Late embryogenesis abundant protein [Vigna unguiculata]